MKDIRQQLEKYRTPLNEVLNSDILKGIIKDNPAEFSFYGSTTKKSKEVMNMLNTYKEYYKAFGHMTDGDADNKEVTLHDYYNNIRKYGDLLIRKNKGYTDDDIVIAVNNVNKLVYKIHNLIDSVINKTDNNYNIEHLNYISQSSDNMLYLDRITDDDINKVYFKDAKKHGGAAFLDTVKLSPLVLYFNKADKLLGSSEMNNCIVNWEKGAVNYEKRIKQLKAIKEPDIMVVADIMGTDLLGIDTRYYGILQEIYKHSMYMLDSVDKYSQGVKRYNVISSTLNKQNRLYTLLGWGQDPEDYCYIFTPLSGHTFDSLKQRKQNYIGTDTNTRFKWERNLNGTIKKYIPVINDYLKQLEKYENIESNDKYNTLYYATKKNLNKDKVYEIKKRLLKKKLVEEFKGISAEAIKYNQQLNDYINGIDNDTFNFNNQQYINTIFKALQEIQDNIVQYKKIMDELDDSSYIEYDKRKLGEYAKNIQTLFDNVKKTFNVLNSK